MRCGHLGNSKVRTGTGTHVYTRTETTRACGSRLLDAHKKAVCQITGVQYNVPEDILNSELHQALVDHVAFTYGKVLELHCTHG